MEVFGRAFFPHKGLPKGVNNFTKKASKLFPGFSWKEGTGLRIDILS